MMPIDYTYNPTPVQPRINALAQLAQFQGQQQQNELARLAFQDAHAQRALQLQESQRLMAQRQAQAAELARLQGVGIAGRDVNGQAGPTGLAQPQQMRPDPLRLIAAGFDPKTIDMVMNANTMGLPEVARTIERADASGRPEVVQTDKFGRPVGAPMRKAVEAKTMNLGGSEMAYDPYALQPGQQFKRTQSPDSIASNATAVRGQNMADARARESTAATLTKPFEVTGPDGRPVLVQQDRRGNIAPVPGYAPKTGADKPMTDAQAKAALFGSRMEAANKVLGELAQAGTDTSIPGSRSGFGIGAAVNAVSPAKQQQLDQAKRDFINATLRRESGAVISDSEFDNGDKQYFPQVGDSAAVKAQKANNRAIAIRGVQAEVPKGNRGVLDEIQGKNVPAGGGWTVKEVR